MEYKRKLLIICFAICLLFAISSVNAGIFEFAEDSDDASDDVDLGDYETKEFKVKISKAKQVKDKISEIKGSPNYDSDFESFETVVWLMDLEDCVLFNTTDGNYLVVNESESDKIPTSDDYSYCIVECELVETNDNDDGDYHLVKNIKVTKKVEKEKTQSSSSSSSSTKSSSGSSKSSSSSSSSYASQSSSSGSGSYPYIGNAATGKFHSYSCHDVGKMLQSNMVFFDSRDEAINRGYVPCGHCHP